jgi:hypothetical protein
MSNWGTQISSLRDDGFAVLNDVISPEIVHSLLDAVETAGNGPSRRERDGGVYALRNLLELPAVRKLSDGPALRSLVRPILGPAARVVRGLLFDKTLNANWKVPWHQDRSIAVTERIEVPGYGPWSTKAGIVHVQPPVRILQSMLTVRISLDDCGPQNGPLQVLPGSHAYGVLSDDQIRALRARTEPVSCTLAAGGVLLMRPLLLHASKSANAAGHRRVIHLEFAACELAGGLTFNA